MIRILIVDDHALVRSGLATLLGSQADMRVVGLASSGEEALIVCQETNVDVAIVDLIMPHLNGAETIKSLRQIQPSLRCIALTSFTDRDLISTALQVGAVSVLFKDISGDELAEVVRRVHAGLTVLADGAAKLLLKSVSKGSASGNSLSSREREVLQLIVSGLNNGEIAYKLNVRPSTVKTYVTRIFSKLNVNSRAQATAVAMRSGLTN